MAGRWDATVNTHREGVRETILNTTWALVIEDGLRAVTMSRIAERAGIGRATLYKYFPDVEAILVAWHQRHITAHLAHLTDLAGQPGPAGDRLEAVLRAYARIVSRRGQHGPELGTLLHHHEDVARAQQQLRELLERLLLEAVDAGQLRGDIAPDELAGFCLHALAAAADLADEDARRRLVTLTMAGLRLGTHRAPRVQRPGHPVSG